MQFRTAFMAAALAGLTLAAHATTFTYNVNYNFPTFTVNGFFNTDINNGVLAPSDITGYSLTIDNFDPNHIPLVLNSADSVLTLTGTGFIASPTGITYDFTPGLPSSLAIHGTAFNIVGFICYQNGGPGGACDNSGGSHILVNNGGPTATMPEFGLQSIANVPNGNPNPVPEPSSLLLLGTGGLGLAAAVRRRLSR
ncbi:MAG: PEP-CTERM sorting domain-containing protein [Acidobacteriota bacterium]|nr:PEP-CTERM sorting domain-containing protein [Acidobacteriota bacterium]